MKNIGNLMKQAQKMQEKMAEMQERMAEMELDGSSGGGMVSCRVNGKGELKSLKLDPSIVDPSDTEVLEDLIVAAVADAKAKAEARMQEEMQEMTGGMGLPPGFKMPF